MCWNGTKSETIVNRETNDKAKDKIGLIVAGIYAVGMKIMVERCKSWSRNASL